MVKQTKLKFIILSLLGSTLVACTAHLPQDPAVVVMQTPPATSAPAPTSNPPTQAPVPVVPNPPPIATAPVTVSA